MGRRREEEMMDIGEGCRRREGMMDIGEGCRREEEMMDSHWDEVEYMPYLREIKIRLRIF